MNIWSTIVLFLPMAGFSILLFLDGEKKNAIKWTAFGFSIATFLASCVMWAGFDVSVAELQFVHQWEWLNITLGDIVINSDYYVGVDGLSMLLVVLTTFIMPIAIMGSFKAGVLEERGRQKLYYALLLLLEWAMLGVFMIQDLIVFYIFWEITLVPMYFLIGIWGSDNRIYAAVKFFLYTMAGSILMLIAILYVGNAADTFVLPEIINQIQAGTLVWGTENPDAASSVTVTSAMLFFGFFVAFAIKVPIFPFHSWLPDAHVQAPTAGSVVLAGVLLKMGTYGLVRFNLQIFPQESVEFAPIIAALGVTGILYGAWVSYAQSNVKKLVAYSSVSHLGFVVLGIFALNSQGIQGATLQMVNHGISTGGLFLIVGFLYERYHSKEMGDMGGVWDKMPLFGGMALVVALSSMGLPGLNGFIGEFTILLGSIGSPVLGFFFTLFGTIGVILAATYILKMYQHTFMGEYIAPPHEEEDTMKLHWSELAVLIPVLLAIFLIGLQPGGFFDVMEASTNKVVEYVEPYYPELELGTEGDVTDDAAALDTDTDTDTTTDNTDTASDDDSAESDEAETDEPDNTDSSGE